MPLPFINPLNPSSFHIRTRLGHMAPYAWPLVPVLAAAGAVCTCLSKSACPLCWSAKTCNPLPHNRKTRVAVCTPATLVAGITHRIIFNRSNGLTTVRLAAPAKPPAIKVEMTAELSAMLSLILSENVYGASSSSSSASDLLP